MDAVDRRLLHRHLDRLPASRPRPFEQRGERVRRRRTRWRSRAPGSRAASTAGDREIRRRRARPTPRTPAAARGARPRMRPGRAEVADRDVDESRVARDDLGGVQSVAASDGGTEVLDEHVGARRRGRGTDANRRRRAGRARTPRLLALRYRNGSERSGAGTSPANGGRRRPGSPAAGSTLQTSAPRSARRRPAKAPRRSVSSTTRRWASGPADGMRVLCTGNRRPRKPGAGAPARHLETATASPRRRWRRRTRTTASDACRACTSSPGFAPA